MEEQVVQPAWLEPVGRMHMLFLHLPIGLLFVMGILALMRPRIDHAVTETIESHLIHVTALVACLTALAGFLLAQQDAYDADAVFWHKWSGAGVSFLAYALLVIHARAESRRMYVAVLAGALMLLVIAGHLGSELTHGEGFIMGTDDEDEQIEVNEYTSLYEVLIQPIMKRKCLSCHNERKAKGGLVMSTPAAFRMGGDNGPCLVAHEPSQSELMRRIKLPREEKEHMPPKSKSQLDKKEEELIWRWIASGAHFDLALKDYPEADSNRVWFSEQYPDLSNAPKVYQFDFADRALVKSLNTPFRSVRQVDLMSPALDATIFVRANYHPDFLSELSVVKDQLVSLNLTNLPVKDDELEILADFLHLEKLILNGTDIDGSGLQYLKNCKGLKTLGLSSTQVDLDQVKKVLQENQLRSISLWNTPIASAEIEALRAAYPNTQIILGVAPSTSDSIALSPPTLTNKRLIFDHNERIQIKEAFDGVITRYTLDGSDPDTSSQIYQEPLIVSGRTTFKARAYKAGWFESEISTFTILQQGHTPDSVYFLTAPNPKYRASGAYSLIDSEKGQPREFRSPYWLGFRNEPLEAIFRFDKRPAMKQITLSFAQNLGAWALPPQSIEVWGGNDPDSLVRIVNHQVLPVDKDENLRDIIEEVELDDVSYRWYKVKATALPKLPAWHDRKGETPWLFCDEVLFY